jgi:hypothetical protein
MLQDLHWNPPKAGRDPDVQNMEMLKAVEMSWEEAKKIAVM